MCYLKVIPLDVLNILTKSTEESKGMADEGRNPLSKLFCIESNLLKLGNSSVGDSDD